MTEGDPTVELVIDKKTGHVRQAGSDRTGQYVIQFRDAAEKSLFTFAVGVLGRTYLTESLHKPWCDSLQTVPPRRKLRLYPRNHGKTSIVSHALPLHMFIQPQSSNLYYPGRPGTDTTILMAGETETLASKNLRVVQGALESNAILRGLWPHVIWDNPRADSKKWNDLEIILPRRTDYPEPSLMARGVGAAITGLHPQALLKDDLISVEAANSEVVMQTAIHWHVASRGLIEGNPDALEILVGCLPASAEILMADGTRQPIEFVKSGDHVWATDTDGRLCIREVEARIPQGFAKTLTVQTSSKTLRATPNHPFLVRRERRLEWTRADELRPGDQVISIKEIPGVLVHPWMDESFCWWFGFLIGDGWTGVGDKRGYLCIALSKDADLNARVIYATREWLPGSTISRTPFGYIRVDTLEGAKGLQSLGLVGGAKDKRLPDWAFQLPPTHRRALLKGFLDADGYHHIKGDDSWATEIMNQGLLEDLRNLAWLCGVRTGIVRHRTRTIKAPNSPVATVSVGWSSNFNLATVDRCEVYHVNWKLAVSKGLRQERVVSVTPNEVEEPVYDLTVQGTPSFFANGLAVHNTRWAAWDLYRYIIENDPLMHVEIRSALEDGAPIYPERFSLETLDRLRKEFGSLFPLLYLNTATGSQITDFDMEDVRTYSIEGRTLLFDEDPRDLDLSQRLEGKRERRGEITERPSTGDDRMDRRMAGLQWRR